MTSLLRQNEEYDQNRLKVNHFALCKSIKYDYMNILTWTILKKTQILNGCETFAFKYITSLVFLIILECINTI